MRYVKVIPGEEIIRQHHLLFFDSMPTFFRQLRKKIAPRLRTRRLREPETHSEYQKAFITSTTSSDANGSGTDKIWEKLKSSLLKAAENVCGPRKKLQWWKRPGDAMRPSTVQSRKAEMLEKLEEWWQQGGISEGQRLIKHVVYLAKFQAKQKVLNDPSPGRTDLFRLTNKLRRENLDVPGKKLVYNDDGELCVDGRAKQLPAKRTMSVNKITTTTPSNAESRTHTHTYPTSKPSNWWNVARLLVHPWS